MRSSSGIDAVPAVISENWLRAKALLAEAIELPENDRARFIAAKCLSEPALRNELLAILNRYKTATRACGAGWTGGTTFRAFVPSLAAPVPTKSEPVLTAGATYGPYRVLKQLGEGGMGEVFLAEDVRLGRRVAMKSLAGNWLKSATARQRLMREARSAAALTHPHIATLYDVLEDAGHLLLVMEYVEGKPISSLLKDGPLPPGHALRLAIQIADAVSYAHDRGIIHCDIKPANVQLGVDGGAKVLDFGLARARYDMGDSDEVTASEQSKLIGTLGYMAPERIVEGTVNASGDIYSLGVVIYEMVTGRHLFDERDVPAFLLTVLGSHVPKPSSAVPGLPEALDEVVARALEKKPMLRYHSARELSGDLQKVLASLEGSRRPRDPSSETGEHAGRPEWQQRAWVAAARVGTALAIFTLAGFVTSTIFHSAFGITPAFGVESALAWPFWGLRALFTPMFVVAVSAAGWVLLRDVCRFSLTRPLLRRWCEPLSRVSTKLSHRLRSLATPALAQSLLIAHCVMIALNYWWFYDFAQGFDSLLVRAANSGVYLSVLAPGNKNHHQVYSAVFSLEVWIFGLAWYRLIKLRLQRHDRGIDISIAGGVALSVVTLMLLVMPYRILWHNEQELVFYKSQTCYMVGRRENEALLFCPLDGAPSNRVVRLDDEQLIRGGTEENVFARVGIRVN